MTIDLWTMMVFDKDGNPVVLNEMERDAYMGLYRYGCSIGSHSDTPGGAKAVAAANLAVSKAYVRRWLVASAARYDWQGFE